MSTNNHVNHEEDIYEGYLPLDEGFSTRALHSSQKPSERDCRSIVAPISISSNFKIDDIDYSKRSRGEELTLEDNNGVKGYLYGRWANPSRDDLEKTLASLDNAKYGLCYASGMCALTGVVELLGTGDHLVCAQDAYGGTQHFLDTVAKKNGLQVSHFDPTSKDSLIKAIHSNTKMVLVESPTNPLVKVNDLRMVADTAHQVSKDIIVVVDNTFLTSYFQKPLALGADIVLYSLTKCVNGHDDVIMGAVTTSDHQLHEKLRYLQNYMGLIAAPFDCSMVSRSLKTLSVRLQAQFKGSIQVAKFLEKHPGVENVLHPGLPSHPQHELSKRQSSGHSGLLSFCVKGVGLDGILKFLKALKIIHFAGSLGGVETLAEPSALISLGAIPAEERARIGATDNLVRLSVGLENPKDICKDIDQALKITLCN